MVANTRDINISKAEAGGPGVQSQPGLHSKTVSPKNRSKNQTNRRTSCHSVTWLHWGHLHEFVLLVGAGCQPIARGGFRLLQNLISKSHSNTAVWCGQAISSEFQFCCMYNEDNHFLLSCMVSRGSEYLTCKAIWWSCEVIFHLYF